MKRVTLNQFSAMFVNKYGHRCSKPELRSLLKMRARQAEVWIKTKTKLFEQEDKRVGNKLIEESKVIEQECETLRFQLGKIMMSKDLFAKEMWEAYKLFGLDKVHEMISLYNTAIIDLGLVEHTFERYCALRKHIEKMEP